ncbi:hypothetical protein IQ06DRAFT_103584 [Phaeosphaeriaceae sp. SRC1lsM3a]|nr:hypothetical protein IQ06DRAFT_103584 [Stagonospora sp. SRC1lsM3a]
MVVDGLDRYQELKVIERFLPKRGSGQILITTRNRHLANNLIDWQRMRASIKMEYSGIPEAMELLKKYIGDDAVATDFESAKQLVLQIKCPELIHDVSRYMVVRSKTCKDMLKIFKERRYEAIERIRPDFAEYLISRALGVSLRDECEWSDELRLLILLCQFDHATGVHIRLIKVEFDSEDHPRVEEWLETLMACDFVWKKEASDMYLVNTTVHLATMTWLETHETSTHKLGRFNKMLSTLYRSYDRRKKKLDLEKRNDKQSRQPKSLEYIKASLMPHFNRFVEYARDAKIGDPFVFYFRAVQAVTLFSDVLLHENHHKDAIKVLEFTQQYFKLGDLWHPSQERHDGEDGKKKDGQTRRRQRNAYFQLNLALVKGYLFRPKGDAWLERLEKAQELVRRLQEEAASDDDTILWGGKTLRTWNLDIELVRVLWKSNDFEAAKVGLRNIGKINFRFIDREAVLPSHHDVPYSFKDKGELQILAIRAKREHSLLELAHGDKHEYNGRQTKARSCWRAAYDACCEAQIAVEQWSLTRNNISSEIREDKAKILFRLGGKKNLDMAENILQRVMHPANVETGMRVDGELVATEPRQRFGNMYRRKELERAYLFYAIRLKRRESADLKNIGDCLEKLVKATGENLGEYHELSTACIRLLVDAYKATDQEQKALGLEKTLSMTCQLEERSQWTRPLKRWRRESWGHVLGFIIFAAMFFWCIDLQVPSIMWNVLIACGYRRARFGQGKGSMALDR